MICWFDQGICFVKVYCYVSSSSRSSTCNRLSLLHLYCIERHPYVDTCRIWHGVPSWGNSAGLWWRGGVEVEDDVVDAGHPLVLPLLLARLRDRRLYTLEMVRFVCREPGDIRLLALSHDLVSPTSAPRIRATVSECRGRRSHTRAWCRGPGPGCWASPGWCSGSRGRGWSQSELD